MPPRGSSHCVAPAGTSRALEYSVIDRLNALLRAELAAVAGYQQALRALKRRADAGSEQLLRLAAEHQRTVTALHGSVAARGGAPVLEARPWEGCGAILEDDGPAAILEDRESVGALLGLEQRGLLDYEAALSSLDGDARELVELELLPRQRRHVALLDAIHARLAA